MSDLVSRVLAAVEEAEQEAPSLHREGCDSLPPPEGYDGPFPCDRGVPAAVLRRCAADREIVEWCQEVIGDWDLGNYGQDGRLKDHPQSLAVTLAVETLKNLESGFGISVEEETT